MYNLNGWICIRESYELEDNNIRKIINQIEEKIQSELIYDNEFYEIKYVNDEYYLNITVGHNHEENHSITFIKWICSIARSSFGVIYEMNDEKLENGFKIWVIKKGVISFLNDNFLSPINIKIE